MATLFPANSFPYLVGILCVLIQPSLAIAQVREAKLTDPSITFHRLYVLGAYNDRAEELNRADDLQEVQGDLEALVNDRHPDLGYVNQAPGSTSSTLQQPTKKQLQDELNRLKELAQPGEEVTFYYGGHGGGGPDYGLHNPVTGAGEKYDEHIWINDADGDQEADWSETVTDDQLAEMLRGFRPGVTLVVFMTGCFGGGFTGAPGDIEESSSVVVIGSNTTCPRDMFHGRGYEIWGVELFSGNTFGSRAVTSWFGLHGALVQTLTEDLADGAGEREADANQDGIVTGTEMKTWLIGEGWPLGPPNDECAPGSCEKPKNGNSDCVGPMGPCNLPVVLVDPSNARAGFLPVRGERFGGGSEVKLDLITGQGSQFSSANSATDAMGFFQGYVPVSGLTPGTYMLTAAGTDGFRDHLILNILDEEPGAETANTGSTLPYRMLTGILDNVPAVNSFGLLQGVQGGGLELRRTASTGAVELEPAPGGGERNAHESEPLIYIEALGGPTGEVYEVTVLGDVPPDLNGYAAIEPVDVSSREREEIVEELRDAGGARQTFKANGYCLDYAMKAPPAGAVFRLAGSAAQEAFRPLAQVLEAALQLHEQGLLQVDSNPDAYFHSIRQWALWTVKEDFDQEEFITAFSKQVRENLETGGTAWTDAVAAAVRRHGENRWRDIEQVLELAGRAEG